MSYVYNMIYGGSGGSGGPTESDAILTVTVPTGSAVTATKGGITLNSTLWVQAADASLDCALFVISPAQFDANTPWTVTATQGTDTASTTVLIDSNKQYDTELSYHYFLYNRGDQFVDRTGGWAASRDTALVFRSDHIHLFGGTYPYLYTVNKVAKLNFTKLVFNIQNGSFGTSTNSGVLIGFGTAQTSATTPWIRTTNEGPQYLDISSVSDLTRYVNSYVYPTGESCDITQIWLE